MRRREFIALLGGAAAAWPVAARAQQPKQMRLVGVLQDLAENEPVARSEVVAFREALAKLGWTEGSNFRIEVRWGAGNSDRMKVLAKELVDLRPDAILARGTPVTGALEEIAPRTERVALLFNCTGNQLNGSRGCGRADDNLIAFRTNLDAGHAGAAGRFDRLREVALAYAFAIKIARAAP
jgi:hypothetical protein